MADISQVQFEVNTNNGPQTATYNIKDKALRDPADCPILTSVNDTVANWRQVGTGLFRVSSTDLIVDQPNQNGFLFNYVDDFTTGANIAQMFIDFEHNSLYTRGGDTTNNWNGSWAEAGGGSVSAWGDLTGNISDQTDLQNALNGKLSASDTLPIANGGTGATTAAAARNALGLGNTTGALPIANGGTGATAVADARTNLGITAIATRPNYTYSKTDLTAGTSALDTGKLYFVYTT